MISVLSLCLGSAITQAEKAPAISVQKVVDNVYMITGEGGNIGLSIGEDGAFLIDDKFDHLAPAILTAVEEKSPDGVKYLVNTHWHFDHAGGNESMAKSGAMIIAHENVRRRMATGQFMKAFNRKVPPAPKAALPRITFTDEVSLHWNDDTISVVHLTNAHTDGDAFVLFAKANVIHTGDIFFNGFYPFIDAGSGGSLKGVIEAADEILQFADPNTKIIPGHGPLATKGDLQRYRDMLHTVLLRLDKAKSEGMTKAQVIASKPTADLDAQWGGGFLKPDVWVGIVWDSL